MPQNAKKIASAISSVRQQLDIFVLGDTESLIQIGSGLENLVETAAETHEFVTEPVTLVLTGLQAIFQEETSDPARLVRVLSETLVALEKNVGAPTNPVTAEILRHSVEHLRDELGAPTGSPAPETRPIPSLDTLDEIAIHLIQVQPEDREDFQAIREALKHLAEAESNSTTRKVLIKAARESDRIASGRDKDPEATIASIGNLIDQANSPESATREIPVEGSATPTVESIEEPVRVVEAAPVAVERDQYLSVRYECDVLAADTDVGLVGEFVTESSEMLEAAESALLALESDLENIENVDIVFRAFHTIKGTAAYIGLARVAELAHLAESLLSRMRDREIQCSGGYANLALRSLDALKEMLSSIDGFPIGLPIGLPADYSELRRVLENPEANGISGRSALSATIEDDVRGDVEEHAIPIGEILADMGKITIEQLKAVLDKKGNRLTGEVLIHEGLVTLEDVTEALGKQKAADIKRAASSESTVRVRTERLDRLIDIVGELVIAQSMLTQDSTVMQGTHHELSRKISHAGKIVRDLQDLSMGMRMVPLKSTFQKMTRLVRDVAQKCGKQVEFITVGEDTEIDRNMVDLISDPLVHMVRNAADHGIELPSVRLAAGKPIAGKIRLAAYHSGGDVVVELKDDGKGIDRDAVVAKAIANGLIESEKGMTEDQIYNLILAPGFSTAAEVTAVSGRGVGMDVVKRNIEAMRGRISISSEKGGGTLFTIRLPLTLAITDGMLTRIGDERFIIPIVNIQISFQPSESMLSSIAGRGELVSLRGELMPIFRLHRLFDVKGAIEDPTKGLLMIVADGRKRCALLVDELLGQQQVVAKNLGEGMGKIQGVSGGAILGDGCVGLILDTPELVAMARENSTQNIHKHESKPQKAA